MNNELKVSLYLNREGTQKEQKQIQMLFTRLWVNSTIGNIIAQLGSKLKIEERIWNVKSGRVIDKSRVAVELNREINKK